MPTTLTKSGVKNTYPEKYIAQLINGVIYTVDKYIHTTQQYKAIAEYRDNWNEINQKILNRVYKEVGLYVDSEDGYYKIYQQYQKTLFTKCAIFYLEELKSGCSQQDIQYYGGVWKIDNLIKQYSQQL